VHRKSETINPKRTTKIKVKVKTQTKIGRKEKPKKSFDSSIKAKSTVKKSGKYIGPHLPGSPITTLSDSIPTSKFDKLPLNQHGKINYDKHPHPGQAHGDPMKRHMNSKKNRFDKMK
jgi:hypothetical protein